MIVLRTPWCNDDGRFAPIISSVADAPPSTIIIIIIFIIITHREITISGVVSNLESDNATPYRAWTFERRSLFEVETVCNR